MLMCHDCVAASLRKYMAPSNCQRDRSVRPSARTYEGSDALTLTLYYSLTLHVHHYTYIDIER